MVTSAEERLLAVANERGQKFAESIRDEVYQNTNEESKDAGEALTQKAIILGLTYRELYKIMKEEQSKQQQENLSGVLQLHDGRASAPLCSKANGPVPSAVL